MAKEDTYAPDILDGKCFENILCTFVHNQDNEKVSMTHAIDNRIVNDQTIKDLSSTDESLSFWQ